MFHKVASAEAAARVDAYPPLKKLLDALLDREADVPKGEAVIYWMRMEDMRSASGNLFINAQLTVMLLVLDNRALSLASQRSQKDGIPLIVLFILSPQDYTAHDRGSRRIDFMLRNLGVLKVRLNPLILYLALIKVCPGVTRQAPHPITHHCTHTPKFTSGKARLAGNRMESKPCLCEYRIRGGRVEERHRNPRALPQERPQLRFHP